jgi:CRISPR-associated protein Cas2
MNHIKHYLICYDITSNKRRYRLDKLLAGFGERIQLSIYECRLTQGEVQQLVAQMKGLIADEDNILVYPNCHWCCEKRLAQGDAALLPQTDFTYF